MKAQFEKEQSVTGKFQRQEDAFRSWISADGSTPYAAVAGRYHLYVSLACPWASRTVIFRKLKGLEQIVGLTVLDPIRDERGWAFRDGPDFGTDPVNSFHFLSEAYRATDPDFDGRVTVPVLWDRQAGKIVNNSEDDICAMFNGVFDSVGGNKEVDFRPDEIDAEHGELAHFIYNKVNNGVYQAGFATRQRVYERACRELFEALDHLDARLAGSRYLFPNRLVEADWRLFCTLVRFDAIYHGHFKCNIRRILAYPNLQGFLMDLYQYPGIAGTVNFDHIKRHYYITHTGINPTGIVPLGPALDLTGAHGRESLP